MIVSMVGATTYGRSRRQPIDAAWSQNHWDWNGSFGSSAAVVARLMVRWCGRSALNSGSGVCAEAVMLGAKSRDRPSAT
jgi:hypothetical protein